MQHIGSSSLSRDQTWALLGVLAAGPGKSLCGTFLTVSESSNMRREKGKRSADLLHSFVPTVPVVREKGSFPEFEKSAQLPLPPLATATLVSSGAGGGEAKEKRDLPPLSEPLS